MRFVLLTALAFSLVPSIASAQDWKDWVNRNPTYPSQAQSAPVARPATVPPATSPAATSNPSSGISSTQSPAFEQLFMKGCTSQGGPQANGFCACTLTEIQNTHTIQELNQLGLQMQQTGELPESFQTIVLSCISRLQ
jgi:hypothetical protein